MKIVFRTDASIDIGTGHVMRCLTLASALRDLGAQCAFICRDHPGNLVDVVRERGFETHVLRLDEPVDALADRVIEPVPTHAAWLCGSWQADAEQTHAALGQRQVDWLIVDHYGLDAQWESSLHSCCKRLMVLDDIADRSHACDLLLDHNPGRIAAHYSALVPRDCKTLCGAEYALLRREFSCMRAYSMARRVNSRLSHLLIALGGVDRSNVTADVLNALRGCNLPDGCRITVALGRNAPWAAHIRDIAADMPWPTKALFGVEDMPGLLADSDLAVGAAGVSALERCCMGLPTLTIVLAANQQSGAAALLAAGAVRLLEAGVGFASSLREQVYECTNPTILNEMQQRCLSIVDGRGLDRVISELTNECG